MQTLLSYSLRDFLLFSKDVWLVLHHEYLTTWWWIPLLINFCIVITLFWQGYIKHGYWLALLTQLFILLSCLAYYHLFYRQINAYADVLSALVAVQMAILFLIAAWQKGKYLQNTPFERGLFYRRGHAVWYQKALYIGVVLFLLPSVGLFFFNPDKVLMLPGTHPLPGLLVLLYLAKSQREFSTIYYIAPTILVSAEIVTLYALELPYWWGYLALLLLVLLLPNRSK